MASRSPTPATAHSVGRERFGKYEILRRIAIGGMAEIYLARALGIEGFEKQVVLKRILPQYADNEEFVRMFLDEARLAAMLHHANIVQVFDIGAVDGQYFLSMEFLHGQDTRQLIKQVAKSGKPLPLEHALTIVMGVCAGLHHAHEHCVDGRPLNLVHRDVSPQNIFVTYDGGVKLLDFGIARAESRLSETRSGTLKGKIAYMSPEQCSGWPIDRRSDVFSAAILLWELTTGRRLFHGDNDFEILRKIKDEDSPRPSTLSFAYPLALERIVLRGLRRDPAERYPTAEAMQLDLEAFAREQGLPTSNLLLARYMRELFRDKIAAWERAEREDAGPPAEPQTTPSGNLVRTQTSVPVPPDPTLPLRPAVAAPLPAAAAEPTRPLRAAVDPTPPDPAPLLTVPQPELDDAALLLIPRRRGHGWIAVALGVAAGSLVTWLLVARPSTATVAPPAASGPPMPARASEIAPPMPARAGEIAPPMPARASEIAPPMPARATELAPPLAPPRAALSAPRAAAAPDGTAASHAAAAEHAATTSPAPAAAHAASPSKVAPAAPVRPAAVPGPARPAAAAPARHAQAPAEKPAVAPAAPKRAAPPRRATHKPAPKKPSSDWDPEALLPP